MTSLSLEQLDLQLLDELVQEEVSTSWRVANQASLHDPMLSTHTQAQTRSNMSMSRIRVDSLSLELHAARTIDHLIDRLAGVDEVQSGYLGFADGTEGILLEYGFKVMGFQVIQLQALRLDGDVLTRFTYCTEGSLYSEQIRDRVVQMLTSLKMKES